MIWSIFQVAQQSGLFTSRLFGIRFMQYMKQTAILHQNSKFSIEKQSFANPEAKHWFGISRNNVNRTIQPVHLKDGNFGRGSML